MTRRYRLDQIEKLNHRRSEIGLIIHGIATIIVPAVAAITVWLALTGLGQSTNIHRPVVAVGASIIAGALVLIICIFGLLDSISNHKRRFHKTTPELKGQELLLKLLTPEQRMQYKNDQTITVPIMLKDKKYGEAVIGNTINGVIWNVRPDPRWYEAAQCVNVSGHLVKEDDLIAKLLWLRSDPRALADVSQLRVFSEPRIPIRGTIN